MDKNSQDKLRIIDEPELFSDNYPLSYRLVILHAAWSYLNDPKNSQPLTLRELFESMIKKIQEDANFLTPGLYIPGFLELYTFHKGNQLGYLDISLLIGQMVAIHWFFTLTVKIQTMERELVL